MISAILSAMLLSTLGMSLDNATPVPVTLKQNGEHWQLLRGGKPYRVLGVGGTQNMELLAESGGNSMRTWGVDRAGEELDAADKLGLTLSVGIWLGHKSYFDYGNAEQVKKQFDAVEAAVLKHRNHPAVLVWGLGNEMEMHGNDTPQLWTAIEDLAKMVKKHDPNHPVMTVVAEVSAEKIRNIQRYAPSIDILGVNSYGGLPTLPKRLKEFGWTKPWMVTEFGPLGPWERPKTAWDAPLEQHSSDKANFYATNYQNSIASSPGCIGSYAFLWGEKQEVTPTWFGMFLKSGEATEAVDVMTHAWTGKWPAQRAPQIRSFSVSGQDAKPGMTMQAKVEAIDPNSDALTYRWQIQEEVDEKKYAGEGEKRPEVVVDLKEESGPSIEFKAPEKPGNYRLYLWIFDGKGKAATANAPFRIQS
jgi:hypothetical protein